MPPRASLLCTALLSVAALIGLIALPRALLSRSSVSPAAIRPPDAILRDVLTLASPSMRGRGEESGGASLAAAWIEGRLKGLGLKTERQPFTIERRRLLQVSSLEIPGTRFQPGADFAPLARSASGDVEAQLEAGLSARISRDARRMAGKIAVEHLGAAAGRFRTLDPPLVERALAYQALGAAAVVFVADFHDPEAGGEAAWPFRLGARAEAGLKDDPEEVRGWLRDRAATGAQARTPVPSRPLLIPAVLVSSAAGRSLDAVAGARAHLRVAIELLPLAGQNVLALVPGADPRLPAVLVSAHYDSHGVQPPSPAFPDGHLYPGACDNASGVAVLLAVAEALSQGPPLPRPVLFACFGGEELGLHGSRAFAAALPTLPGGLLCDLNVDMAARGDEKEIWIVGSAFAPELAALAKGSLEGAGFAVKTSIEGGTSIDFTYRFGSDHWSLHRAGIPSILVTCSRFPGCDRPEDTPDLCSAAKMKRVAEGVLAAVRAAAARDSGFAAPVDAIVKFPGEK